MTTAVLLVEARDLSRIYQGGGADVTALAGVDLAVAPSSLVVVRGRSGSGKTTLLNLLGRLDTPTAGTVAVDGVRVDAMDGPDLTELRRATIRFVFQSFGLLPILTAVENVELPMRRLRATPTARRERARHCWNGSASPTGPNIALTSCRVANNSGWPSPVRSPTVPD